MSNFEEIVRINNEAKKNYVNIEERLKEIEKIENDINYPRCFVCTKVVDVHNFYKQMRDPWGLGHEVYGCVKCIQKVNNAKKSNGESFGCSSDAFLHVHGKEMEWYLLRLEILRRKMRERKQKIESESIELNDFKMKAFSVINDHYRNLNGMIISKKHIDDVNYIHQCKTIKLIDYYMKNLGLDVEETYNRLQNE